MSRHDEFETLAEKVLLTLTGKGRKYIPPEDASMIVDTALAITTDFLNKLRTRRIGLDTFDGLLPTEFDLLRNKQKLMAIKSVKERTGVTIKEAKTLVEKAALEFVL